MMLQYLFLCLSTFLLLHTASSLSSPSGGTACNCSQSEEMEAVLETCEAYQLTGLLAVKEIFDHEQNCSPFRKCSQKELIRTQARLAQTQKTMSLMARAFTSVGVRTREARVPHPVIFTSTRSSVNLSCESGGQQLESCIWGRTVNGQWEVILVDSEVVQNGGRTDAEGISYVGGGLNSGNCGIKIDFVRKEDLGGWSCTLIAKSGDIFKGTVKVEGPAVFFVAINGIINAYLPTTPEVHTIIEGTNEQFFGMAYDSLNDRLYWSTAFRNGTWSICRASRNGTGMERTLQATEYALTFELAFDWITGNLYGVTLNGFIFVCDPRRIGGSFSCATVLQDQGKVEGIALNPIAGLMYFSSGDSIIRAEMDGTNRVPNFILTNAPRGIFFDPEDSRLYWSSVKDGLIQSSNMAGNDIRTIIRLGTNTHPQGIAVMGDRIYWTDHFVGKLESSKKDGTDRQTLYNGTDKVMHLVAAPTEVKGGNRANDCYGQCGARICVLNAHSFRCLGQLNVVLFSSVEFFSSSIEH